MPHFDIQFPISYTYISLQNLLKQVDKNLINERSYICRWQNIPPVTHHDEDIDYDDYNAPNTNRVDETNLNKRPGYTMTTLTLWDKVKWDNLAALYIHLKLNRK